MIKILSLNGSPIKDSSCQIALVRLATLTKKRISTDTDDEVSITHIDLNDLSFTLCQSCGEAPTPKFCFYEDALTPLYQQIVECDIFLIGSPIYFDAVSSQAKAFVDRCNCFRPADFKGVAPPYPFIKILKIPKRPGAMVLTGGKDAWFEGARRTFAGLFKWLEVADLATIKYCSDDYNAKGTIVSNQLAMKEIDEASKLLSAKILEKK